MRNTLHEMRDTNFIGGNWGFGFLASTRLVCGPGEIDGVISRGKCERVAVSFGCPELAVGKKGINIMCRHCLTGNSDLFGERSKDL